MTNVRQSRQATIWLGHAARLAVVAAVAWFVHAEHRVSRSRERAAGLDDLPVATIQRHLPEAVALGGASPAVAGARDLVDPGGGRVGTVFRTSPEGDGAIGFSGPTDLLVVCDRDLRVAGVEILTSRDTHEHVAAVIRDPGFLGSFRGQSLEELAGGRAVRPDGVAGSTLTCQAIREAVATRLGASAATTRFTSPPSLHDFTKVYPTAARIETDPGDPTLIRVVAADDIPLGWALRTSPAADRTIGYQGPTDAAICFDTEGRVAGVVVAKSYDNEPYVGYVRDDRAFRRLWKGLTLEELAGLDPVATGVEGVSGATMTSQAIAAGIVRAAHGHGAEARHAAGGGPWPRLRSWLRSVEPPQWGGLAVIAMAIVTAFTRLRGSWFGRLALPAVVLAYLGFGAGALVSQAQLWGWAQSGLPRGAVVLSALTLAAVLLPATTRRNVYCSHLCAHGAAQQLVARIARPRRSMPRGLRSVFAVLPWALVVVAVVTTVLRLPIALVALEPFDAYLPAIAGVAPLVIFLLGLLASGFVPMAYCRHACPTGALLDHLRLNGRSNRAGWRDGLMLGCLAVAAAAHWWPR